MYVIHILCANNFGSASTHLWAWKAIEESLCGEPSEEEVSCIDDDKSINSQ